jgi:hypothetical protein
MRKRENNGVKKTWRGCEEMSNEMKMISINRRRKSKRQPRKMAQAALMTAAKRRRNENENVGMFENVIG